MTERDRRRQPRTVLTLPVAVQGQYPDGTAWEEGTTTLVASACGAAVHLGRSVRIGQTLHLTLPLPKRFRSFDLGAPLYRVYAAVCSLGRGGEVGLSFLGKEAPEGYSRGDDGLYLTPPAEPSSPERRTAPRRDGMFFFVLKPRSNHGERQEEATVADNLGVGGARIMTTQFFAKDEVVDVEEAGGPFRTRAAVRNAFMGQDAVWRLNLMFLDAQTPERLLAQ